MVAVRARASRSRARARAAATSGRWPPTAATSGRSPRCPGKEESPTGSRCGPRRRHLAARDAGSQPRGPAPPRCRRAPGTARARAAARCDRDRDGLSDARERRLGTSPLDRDSDDDGLSDGREVPRTHTSPRRRDSDRDGLPDGLELGVTRAIADPAGSVRGTDRRRFRPTAIRDTHTDPRRRDTDRDGSADGREDRNRNGRRDRGEPTRCASAADGFAGRGFGHARSSREPDRPASHGKDEDGTPTQPRTAAGMRKRVARKASPAAWNGWRASGHPDREPARRSAGPRRGGARPGHPGPGETLRGVEEGRGAHAHAREECPQRRGKEGCPHTEPHRRGQPPAGTWRL